MKDSEAHILAAQDQVSMMQLMQHMAYWETPLLTAFLEAETATS
jgi:hypothetical protein